MIKKAPSLNIYRTFAILRMAVDPLEYMSTTLPVGFDGVNITFNVRVELPIEAVLGLRSANIDWQLARSKSAQDGLNQSILALEEVLLP